MTTRLTLYTRSGCHLCEQAEDLLAMTAASYQVVDVDADEAIRQAYGLRVPVLLRGETVLLEGRIEERDLLALVASLP